MPMTQALFTQYRITFHAGSFHESDTENALECECFHKEITGLIEPNCGIIAYLIHAEPRKQNPNPI